MNDITNPASRFWYEQGYKDALEDCARTVKDWFDGINGPTIYGEAVAFTLRALKKDET